MARPLTSVQLKATFLKWGVPHTFTAGCESRKNKGQWIDVVGLMFHHTAMDASDAANLRVLINGHSTLPGPLANFGEGDDGVTDVVALGPANHAGGGDPSVLASVRKESYSKYPPKTTKTHGQTGSVIGNSYFYGWEVYYGIGSDKTIDPIQYRGTVLSMVAVIDKLDELDGPTRWTSKSIIGHKEWQLGKPDPAGVDMAVVRADAQWCLDHGPVAAKRWYLTGSKVAPTPPPTTPGVPVAQQPVWTGTDQQKKDGQALLGHDVITNPVDPKSTTNGFWSLRTWFGYIGRWVVQIRDNSVESRSELAQMKSDIAEIKAAILKNQQS